MFYVYALIDPRTDQPFYIGKGKGKRCLSHLKPCNLRTRSRKASKIKAIMAQGLKVKVEKLYDGLSEQEAYDRETELVALYGRLDKGTGILTNMTDGGPGSPDNLRYERTTSHRKSLAKTAAKRVWSEEERQAHSQLMSAEGNGMFGRHHDESARAKMSEAHAKTGRTKGASNPKAKTIHIFNADGVLVFECVGNFEQTCKANNLPLDALGSSYKRNGAPIFTKKKSNAYPHCTGWYAICV